jgi:hypothetical protein
MRSYNASFGFFEIVYTDGNSKELEYSEVTSLFQAKQEFEAHNLVHERPQLGRRKPKK